MKTMRFFLGLALIACAVMGLGLMLFDGSAHTVAGVAVLATAAAPPIDIAELTRKFDANFDGLKQAIEAASAKAGETGAKQSAFGARLTELEQFLAARKDTGGGAQATWGNMLIESAEFKALVGSPSQKGKAAVQVPTSHKLVTSPLTSGGALIPPDVQVDPVMLAQRRPTVRALLAPGKTSSNAVWFARQTLRTNNARVVTEGSTKPESDISFEQKQAPVATIATFVIGSRQLLDDAPAMASTIDGELRYMLDYVEEDELLNGDGTGAHIRGLIPEATPFNAPFVVSTSQNNADILIAAIAQAEQALLPATGIILNTLDWLQMLALKDGQGRYLSNGPFGPAQSRLLWDLPVAPTLALEQGEFLVGSFAVAAQIFDRMDAEVLVSSEDSDNFRKNLITIRAEKRLALAVKRPQAIIYGDFDTAT